MKCKDNNQNTLSHPFLHPALNNGLDAMKEKTYRRVIEDQQAHEVADDQQFMPQFKITQTRSSYD